MLIWIYYQISHSHHTLSYDKKYTIDFRFNYTHGVPITKKEKLLEMIWTIQAGRFDLTFFSMSNIQKSLFGHTASMCDPYVWLGWWWALLRNCLHIVHCFFASLILSCICIKGWLQNLEFLKFFEFIAVNFFGVSSSEFCFAKFELYVCSDVENFN